MSRWARIRCVALILLLAVTAAVPARAQLTQQGVDADINTMLLSCGTGCNTAATLRSLLDVMVSATFQAQGLSGLILSGTPSPGWVPVATDAMHAAWGPIPPISVIAGISFSGTPSVGWVPIATSSSAAVWGPQATSPNVYNAANFGMACNDVTDDTAPLNTLLQTVTTAGGGTIVLPGLCLISSGTLLFPNGQAGAPFANSIRITGASWGSSYGSSPLSKAGLDLRFNAPLGKLDMRGQGAVELDHIALIDGGSDCAPFIFVTNTSLSIHEASFLGTAQVNSACNDAVVWGGTSSTPGFGTNAPYQGYPGRVTNTTFSKIRAAGIFNTFANGIKYDHNTIDNLSGSNLTTPITAASNAAAAVLTITGHGWQIGQAFNIIISGATGSWIPINGSHAVTVLGANTISIPVNSGGFGALTGSPVFFSGAAFIENGVTQGDGGNLIESNLVEMGGYPYFVSSPAFGGNNALLNNLLFDNASIAVLYIGPSANTLGTVINGFGPGTGIPTVIGQTSNITVIDSTGDGPSIFNVQQASGNNIALSTTRSLLVGGGIGIGSVSATTDLNSNKQISDPTGSTASALFSRTLQLTAPNANDVQGGVFGVSLNANAFNETGTITGTIGQVASSNTATLSNVTGHKSLVYNVSTGTMTAAKGVDSQVQNLNAGGNIGTFYSYYAGIGVGFNLGTIGTWYGMYVDTPPSPNAPGTSWAVFTNGSTPSRFGGTVTSLASVIGANLQSKTIYSAAGTPVPTCNGAAEGTRVSVSDTTGPTYHGTYTSGGAVHGPLYCDGTNWLND